MTLLTNNRCKSIEGVPRKNRSSNLASSLFPLLASSVPCCAHFNLPNTQNMLYADRLRVRGQRRPRSPGRCKCGQTHYANNNSPATSHLVNKGLFGDDPVGPLNELHEDCGTAEFCTPTAQVCFRDPTGPGTGSSSKNGNVFSHDLLAHFGEGRPTDRKHRLRGHIAHQVRGFARKEDLDLVTSVG